MTVKYRPLKDKILIHNLENGLRTLSSGIVLLNDDGKQHGIRARWAQVYAVGPDINYLNEGQWVLIEHGRWTRSLEVEKGLKLMAVDNSAILVVSDDKPDSKYVGNTAPHGEYAKIRL